MTDPSTGTSASPPDGGVAGTQAGGTEGGGKGRTPTPEDLAALAKAHEANLVKEREKVRQLEAERDELRARAMGASAPPVDPYAELRERAAYDDGTRLLLQQQQRLERAEIESQVTDAVQAAGVEAKLVPLVKQLIRDSGYTRSVADAVKLARGTEIDKVETENATLKAEVERLKAEATRVKVSVATMPAAIPLEATTISGTDYNAILSRGGPEAKALYERVNSPKGTPNHVELDLHS